MESEIRRWTAVFGGLVGFSVLGTILVRLLNVDAGRIPDFCSLALILVGAYVVALRLGWVASACIAAIGATSEVVGIYTGMPYGRYSYTGVWWPSVVLPGGLSFPIFLPLAWTLVVGSIYLEIGRRFPYRVMSVLITAALAAGVDVAMEPIMTNVLRYWVWLDLDWPLGIIRTHDAPLLNGLGWILVSGLACWTAIRFESVTIEPRGERGILLGGYLLVLDATAWGTPYFPFTCLVTVGYAVLIALFRYWDPDSRGKTKP